MASMRDRLCHPLVLWTPSHSRVLYRVLLRKVRYRRAERAVYDTDLRETGPSRFPPAFKLWYRPDCEIPVLAFAGPVFTYGLRDVSKERTIFNYDDKETEVEYDFYMDDDMANRFDIKLGGGLGIELLDHFVLTAGFNWGLFVANDAVYDVEIL